MSGLDPRTLRRALLRGMIALACALLPSLLARRLVAVPPCLALVFVPYTLVELGSDRPRATVLFCVTTLASAAAFANGVYLEGVASGGSPAAGLAALSGSLGAGTGSFQAAATVLIAAQMIALAFTFAYDMVPADGFPGSVSPTIWGPPLLGVEVAALVSAERASAAPIAAVVFTLTAVGVAFCGALFVLGVSVVADALERRMFREVAT